MIPNLILERLSKQLFQNDKVLRTPFDFEWSQRIWNVQFTACIESTGNEVAAISSTSIIG